MATKYETDGDNGWSVDPKITPVEIEKETETSIWIKGNRHNKVSRYAIYHDTWDQAKEFLVEATSRRLERAHNDLQRAEDNYAKVCQISPL